MRRIISYGCKERINVSVWQLIGLSYTYAASNVARAFNASSQRNSHNNSQSSTQCCDANKYGWPICKTLRLRERALEWACLGQCAASDVISAWSEPTFAVACRTYARALSSNRSVGARSALGVPKYAIHSPERSGAPLRQQVAAQTQQYANQIAPTLRRSYSRRGSAGLTLARLLWGHDTNDLREI